MKLRMRKRDKTQISKLLRIFGLKPNKKPKPEPPDRTGATWRKRRTNETGTVCASDTEGEDQ